MITIHEFGHYLAGKLLGFGVEEFSIGFGPAVFRHTSKRSGELFALRLIPLGGYCAFLGEDGLDPTPSELPQAEQGETGGQEKTGEGEMSRPHETKNGESAVHGMPFTQKKPWERIIVLVAGAAMNYLLALFLILLLFACYGQNLVCVRGVAVSEEYPAEYSFREGDILLGAGKRDLYLTTDIVRAVNGKKAGDLVVFRVAAPLGGGKYAEEERTIMLRTDVKVKNSANVSSVWGALGIGIEELDDGRYYMLSTQSYRFGFFPTVGRSFVYSFKIAGSIFRVIGELLTGKLGLSALGGPVTTITTTSRIVSQGFASFLEIAAFIGVNLAVFNLLPIPALDGSKVVFTAIEWVRGKPISRKVEAVIHAVGFVLLLGFAILVDVLQFL